MSKFRLGCITGVCNITFIVALLDRAAATVSNPRFYVGIADPSIIVMKHMLRDNTHVDITNLLPLRVEKGSKDPKQEKVGKVTIDQVRAIATEKLPDLNCTSIESAMRIIAGTAANMGIDVDPPILEPKKKEVV
ncbi:Large ribosomal subunit protein uL11 [Theobroma cacao]|nr:Large ribosomal subunit protein uL11 [Theobroma cacao]